MAGVLPLPFGTGRHAPIAAEDQARVIANILIDPGTHLGHIYPIFGAKEMTFPEMAGEVGLLLDKSVRYQQVDVPTLKQLAKDNGKEFGDFSGSTCLRLPSTIRKASLPEPTTSWSVSAASHP